VVGWVPCLLLTHTRPARPRIRGLTEKPALIAGGPFEGQSSIVVMFFLSARATGVTHEPTRGHRESWCTRRTVRRCLLYAWNRPRVPVPDQRPTTGSLFQAHHIPLPANGSAEAMSVLFENLEDCRDSFCARPVPLEFDRIRQRADGDGPRLHHTLDS
jgi:hypothetical protein